MALPTSYHLPRGWGEPVGSAWDLRPLRMKNPPGMLSPAFSMEDHLRGLEFCKKCLAESFRNNASIKGIFQDCCTGNTMIILSA